MTKEGDVETDTSIEDKPDSAVRPSSEYISISKGREIVAYYLESGLQPSLQVTDRCIACWQVVVRG